jgi:hypothetical protein
VSARHDRPGGHVLELVEEAKRLRALADAETDPVFQRAILLEADNLRREIAIIVTATDAAEALLRRDARIEHGRAVGARVRLEIAIAALSAARAEVSVTIGETLDTTDAISEALQGARVAAGKLDNQIRYLARVP